ncbi:hypothetical protein DYD21_03565 [Rhodohalobacter sp. SW132]|uniref:toxin-antitoxin system YwqK family antitoxin n=1 Tax=Rhodohalobacter sp. SW132 TaxID=2293433 RepID=UPI000E364838|nr:hypothetical protein [Rhodohalobacter sp. SW132]REL39047.1 hypothetical protein DYD21_03565 [Rhodohalobacter sp. SW132]
MKGSIYILFLLMLFSSCSIFSEERDRVQLVDIFPEINLSEDEGIYIDSDGKKINGKRSRNYRNGNLRADLTFSDGLITDGVIRLKDGTLYADYSIADGLYYHTQYWPDGKPQMMVVYEGNYNNQTEFHVWHENGTPVVASNPYFTRTWYEDGQLRMEILLKDDGEQGIARTWYMNGELKAESHFENNPHAGLYREWDEDGELIKNRVSSAVSVDE